MSDIRETLANLAKNATKSSGDLFKTTKLSMAVSTEQTNLKNLYLEIGKKVHEIYQYGGTLGKFFDDKFHELEACERKIEELKEQISHIKGIRECGKCGKTAERTAEFCPKCGIRLIDAPAGEFASPQPAVPPEINMSEYTPSPVGAPPAPAAPTPPAPAPPPEPTTRSCRVCGMENDINTKFCLSCGRIVG